jgi:FkbM family methyltransferase
MLYQQDTELELLSLLLPYIENKVFLDIGAEKGGFAKFMFEHQFSGILFEPCPKHHEELKRIAGRHPALFYPYAIDSTDREADFFICVDENNETSDYFHSLHYLPDDPNVNHQDRIRVDCRTLNSLMREGVVPKNPGLVKIDTEGNDLQTLKGMGELMPEIIVCEFLTPGLYSGWEDAAPEGLIREAESLGFREYLAVKRYTGQELISMNPAVFIDRQWGNLVFMNERIFKSAFDQLKEAVAESELHLFSAPERAVIEKEKEIETLHGVCDERLALINYLHDEAAKRLGIIEQLTMKNEEPEEKDS